MMTHCLKASIAFRSTCLCIFITLFVSLPIVGWAQTVRLVPATYSTIQAAINASSNGDKVVVSPGVYYENINFSGKNISVVSLHHSTGDPKYIETTIIDGSKPANALKGSVVTFVSGETSAALLDGFTLRRGTGTNGSGFSNYVGGGILCSQSSPVLQNLIVRQNKLGSDNGSGGGIFISKGEPTLNNIYIADTRISAALYITDVNNPNRIVARNIQIENSIDTDGIYITNSKVKLKNVTVNNCDGIVASGMMVMHSTVDLDSAIISGNTRGVDARSNDKITLRNTALIQNKSAGAILCSSSTLELINTTVADNQLNNHYGGAGIFITDEESKITIVNSIFYNNKWRELNTGIVRQNSISFLDDGSELTVDHSNIQGGQAGLKFFDGSANVVLNWLTGNINADPIFYKPEQGDYHLSAGSPSIGTGVKHFEFGGTVYLDLQAGQFDGTNPDMGAFLFSQPYLKAMFSADKTTGQIPLSVQFKDESFGFKTTAPTSWMWDFGDGSTSTSANPTHVYAAKGDYSVRLEVSNASLSDKIVRHALIKTFDSDTLYVATTGSNTTGTGTKALPFKTIQYAIDRSKDDDVVIVADGTYKENLNFHGIDVMVSSYYKINNNVSHISATIIDGNNNGTVVTFSSNEGPNAGLAGLTVQNGFANGNNYPQYYGGGIFIADSDPTFVDVVIKNNKANYRGGGISIDNGDPRMERVTVSSNQTIYTYSEGAGVWFEYSRSVIKDSKFISNASAHYGGGLHLGYETMPEFENVIIQDNSAVDAGGGIYIDADFSDLTNLTIIGNSSKEGGGVYSSFESGSISYSVIAKNSATVAGGGIYYLAGASANPSLDHVTLDGNTSPVGSAIGLWSSSKVHISNSIIWGATAPVISGANALVTYSDVKGGWTGTGNINADPKFKDASNDIFTLQHDSPCINAGNPAVTDPNGTVTDMGAFYFEHFVISGTTQLITTQEDIAREVKVTDLIVETHDSNIPDDLVVEIKAGSHYSFVGPVITPELNYHGELSVTVLVKNSSGGSEPVAIPVTVTPVNDAPVITAVDPFVIDQNASLTITLDNIEISDPDNDGDDFTFVLNPGANYTFIGNTLTPATDFHGTLQVGLRVSDGTALSEVFIAEVVVNEVVTGTEPLYEKMFSLYPNPSSDHFYLTNVLNAKIESITLIALDGREQNVSSTNDGDTSMIDVSHLNPGMYYVRIETNSHISWKKIVIRR